MEESQIEYHPLEPFLPEQAKVLLLGSFPPPRARWSMYFYYPNPQNDMWRVMGLVFFGDKGHFTAGKRFDEERIRAFCTARGIALSDSARAVVRLGGNASDNFLQVVEPRDIAGLLDRLPACRHVAVTGQKAMDTLRTGIEVAEPPVGSYSPFTRADRYFHLWRMPSTSRAYPLAVERKAEAYARMFAAAGLF